MTDGGHRNDHEGVRRRTVLTTALGAVPLVMAGGAGIASAATPAGTGTLVTGLTVEHRTDPLGVDAERPRFGWRTASPVRGRRQTAYRVRVTRHGARVWDTGRVPSSDAVAVRYDGPALTASTRYDWTVTVWHEDGRATTSHPARFETGLLSTDGVIGWDGAQWIGMAGKQPNSAGAPLLRRQTTLTGRAVREARLYISALGVYEAHVNGHRVTVPQDQGSTPELPAPGRTNYDSRISYLTYDVTAALVAGERQVTLAAVLGNGWYNGRVSDGSTY